MKFSSVHEKKKPCKCEVRCEICTVKFAFGLVNDIVSPDLDLAVSWSKLVCRSNTIFLSNWSAQGLQNKSSDFSVMILLFK